jgi:tetratricopeptide (TPR) repeat protein
MLGSFKETKIMKNVRDYSYLAALALCMVVVLLAFYCSAQTRAVDLAEYNGRIIDSIETAGNVHVSVEKILSAARSKAGQLFSDLQAQEDVKRIAAIKGVEFAYYSVEPVGEKVKLIFVVKERIVIKETTFGEDNNATVGELGDPERLVFEGVETFTADQIKDGLIMDSDFLLAAHHRGQLSEYLKAVQEKVQLGYKNNGFPDAQVAVNLDKNAKKIIVKIVEGPRYHRGDVKIIGTRHIPVKKIIERLTYVPSLLEKTRLARLGLQGGASDILPETIWEKGSPASFTEIELKSLRERVKKVLSEFGYFSTKFEVSVLPEQGKSTALLQIKIQNEGPNARIGEIIITGNKRNSREDILKYLNLKVGMKFSQKHIDQINDLLWNSARFLDYKVTTDSNSPKLILKIYAPELEQAPLLSEDFSPAEKTMLKLRKYIISSVNRNDDFVIQVNGPNDIQLKFIISPNKGTIVTYRSESTSPEMLYGALVASLDRIGLYSPYQHKKLIFPKPPRNIIIQFSILPNPNPTDGKFLTLFGGAFATDESSNRVCTNINLAPSYFVYVTHKSDKCAVVGNIMTISDGNSCVKVDTDSGKLLEMTQKGEKGVFALTIENGAFDQTIAKLNESTAELANCFDSQRPTTSTVGYLLEEPTLQKLFRKNYIEEVSPEKFARSMKVLNILVNKNIMGSVDEKVIAEFKNFTDPNKFSLPMDNTDKLVGMVFSIIFNASDEIFPKMSWPWTVAHESIFVAGNKGKYTMEELQRIYESEDTGPIGFWAAAKLLTYVNPQLAPSFADKGIEKLSVGDFRKDYQLLFQSPMLNEVVRNTVAAIRDLRDDEVEALTDIMSPQTAILVRGYIQIARENKSKPANEILSMALDEYWEKELKKRVQKGFAAVYFKIGGMYDKIDRHDIEIEMYKKAINIEPNNAAAYNNLGVEYHRLGHYTEAVEFYKKAIDIEPNDANAYYNLGVSYDGLGRYKEAVESYKKAINLKPDYANAYFNLGYSYYNLKQFEESVDAYKQVLKILPNDVETYRNLSQTYNRASRFEEAVEACKQAVRIKPDYADALYNLGYAYVGLGRYNEAIEAQKQVIKIQPDATDAYIELGVAYSNLGRHEEAIEACKQAIRIKPDFATAYNNIGAAYRDLSRYAEAIENYKQAISIEPNNAIAQSNLAGAYEKLGRYEEAIEAYKQAISIKPDAEAHYNLGVAYYKSGDKDSALKEYEILKTLDMSMANELLKIINR